VSIGSKDGEKVEEARRRIELILDPPTAEHGAEYTGRVVNITKFGAFVNVLPGRDGLLHISKLGRGKRIDRVEDVLDLGDEVTVRVDDIDNSGKLSLSLVGDDDGASGDGSGDRSEVPAGVGAAGNGERGGERAGREVSSFEDHWEGQARAEFGELGPEEGGGRSREGGGRDSGARRGGRGGRGRGGGGGGRR
jgi:polyribonucleotide nucleotidyltransferase